MADRELAQRVAVEATEIFNGKEANFNMILDIIGKHKAGLPDDKIDSVTTNIGDLLNELNKTTQWKFNIPILQENVSGLGAGNMAIIFARPEAGKTAFWVSLVGGRNGFAEQGATVHAFINEEPAVRTQMRIINCCTEMTNVQIAENLEEAHSKWEKIKNNITLIDTIDWALDDIDSHCEKYKPDIIVIDQLDKIGVKGTFSRGDEKLRAIYSGAREISKRRQCCVIAISQASADAHNRASISFDMMENSKTGKAAEADLIIGIGRNIAVDPTDRTRHLCISKNKITGYHGEPDCVFDKHISRYRA
jgi:replicative DNA helicase